MPLLSGKSHKFKVAPPKIRIEKVAVDNAPAPKPKLKSIARPGLSSSARSSPIRKLSPNATSSSIASSRAKSSSPYPSSTDERRFEPQRKRKAPTSASRRSPASDRIEFDKDSDAEDDNWMDLDSHKRQRKASSEDSNRKLRSARAYERKDEGLQFIHAVDVASLEHKCAPIMGASKEDVAIELQYPTLQRREK